jgi:hypothetical protein
VVVFGELNRLSQSRVVVDEARKKFENAEERRTSAVGNRYQRNGKDCD